jgi:hypothetical protein
MTRGGRRLGEVSERIVALAAREEVWSGKVAATLQLSRRDASVTVHDLARSGRLAEVDRRMVAGARKPVPVYRAPAEPDAALPGIPIFDWPRDI